MCAGPVQTEPVHASGRPGLAHPGARLFAGAVGLSTSCTATTDIAQAAAVGDTDRMSRSFLLTADMTDYVVTRSRRPDDVLMDLAEETTALGDVSGMQISHEQGAFLEVIAAATGARSAIEVGTFTGYSSICLTRGMGPGACILCCDASEEWTDIARRYWIRAGIAEQISLRLGPAAETIASLPVDTAFDLAFIDADKTGYAHYVDLLHPMMRAGGLILIDNTLWSGEVLPPGSDSGAQRPEDHDPVSPDTLALRRFNDAMAADERFITMLLPFGDGLTMLVVR